MSDLHVNHGDYVALPVASTLLVAGDISDGRNSIEWLKSTSVDFDRIYFVLGNHELVGECYSDIHKRFKDELSGTCVRVLENEVVEEEDGFAIAGCTLWTDIPMVKRIPVQRALVEYQYGEISPGMRLTADFTVERHKESVAFLEDVVFNVDVIMTHHLPHPDSIAAKYTGNDLNSAFITDLTSIVKNADYWVHGHTHESMDYAVGDCRVVCNPRGYVPYESQDFDEAFLVPTK